MSKKEKTKKKCPFWSPSERICKVANEGLFIPLEDHIEIYCEGSEYPLCRQYLLFQQQSDTAGSRKKVDDRRRSPRIKSAHRLTFLRLTDSGRPISVHPSIANTMDLSSGGMSLITRDLLLLDSIVQFQFTTPVPPALQTGLAKVKWCTPAENNLRYQIGLSFQNDRVIQAMGKYLNSRA